MNRSWLVGLCVILLSAVVSTSVEAQQDKRQTTKKTTKTYKTEKRYVERSSKSSNKANASDEPVYEMTPEQLDRLVNTIADAALQDENACDRLDITSAKDRDLLLLLLQYRNMYGMLAPQTAVVPGQPIQVGGQLYYPAGSNIVVTTPQSATPQSGQPLVDDARLQQLNRLENELAQLRRDLADNKPVVTDNSNLEGKIDALRDDLAARDNQGNNSFENRVIYADRSRNNVQLSRSVFFLVNSSQIRTSEQDAIQNVADFVRDNPRALVLVYGYASIDGPVGFNNELAAKRANSVVKALQDAGIPAVAIKRYDNGIDSTPDKLTDARRVDIDVIF